jgi:hypothetical protein
MARVSLIEEKDHPELAELIALRGVVTWRIQRAWKSTIPYMWNA